MTAKCKCPADRPVHSRSWTDGLKLPDAPRHVLYIDGWRGLCILLVLAGHFVPGLGPLANVGVEFFFVLSGRLMAEILVVRRQPVGVFLRRRVARVVPALLGYVLLVTLVINLSLWLSAMPLEWASPAAALLFVHNYLPESQSLMVFEHCWSLAVEEHSYLLLVAIILAVRRRPRAAAALALAVALIAIANGLRLWAAPPAEIQSVFWRSDVRVASVLVSFAFFALIAGRDGTVRWPGRAYAAPLATLAGLAVLGTAEHLEPLPVFACTIAGAIAVNSLDTAHPRFRRLLESPLLVWAGTLSFSIYLWQQIFYLLGRSGTPASLCLAMAIGCGWLSYRLIERPARDWLNSAWGSSGPRPHGPPQRVSLRKSATSMS